MEMDGADRVRIADDAELTLYCDRVACAVGRHSIRVFGLDPEIGDRLAAALGEALQLTNILRDIVEDAGRNRLYLPGDALLAQGIADVENAEAILDQDGIAAVCEDVAARADRRFAEAADVVRRCDHGKVRPAVIMMQVYRRLFLRLQRRGWARWREPVRVPTREKLWVAFRYGVI
jgi:phytoene synthase